MEEPFDLSKIPEIYIGYKNNVPIHKRPKVEYARDIYKIMLSQWDMNRIELVEQFKIMLLNQSGHVLGVSEIGTGGLNDVSADRRIMFAIALKAAASHIVMVHNHPSGDVRPSEEDKLRTQQISDAGRLLNIRVRDHVIISKHRYYSFVREGIMP